MHGICARCSPRRVNSRRKGMEREGGGGGEDRGAAVLGRGKQEGASTSAVTEANVRCGRPMSRAGCGCDCCSSACWQWRQWMVLLLLWWKLRLWERWLLGQQLRGCLHEALHEGGSRQRSPLPLLSWLLHKGRRLGGRRHLRRGRAL